MKPKVLLGDPAQFHIQYGANPHTRTFWGFRKKVNTPLAVHQWNRLKELLEGHGIQVIVIPAVSDQPGLVFPANAGFRYKDSFFLSNLNPGRAGEKELYRPILSSLGLTVVDFPSPFPFEGEADFIPVGNPSGDPSKTVYLFTYGRIERLRLSDAAPLGPPASQRWQVRFGIPPYRRVYGFRSDLRALQTLQKIVSPNQVIPLELIDEAHYHGDTVLYSFGPCRENLLVDLNGLSPLSQDALRERFKDRLLPIDKADAHAFAANSFQSGNLLFTPDGLTQRFYEQIRDRGVIPCPVDVSEFLNKGGGAVKCMILDLSEPGERFIGTSAE